VTARPAVRYGNLSPAARESIGGTRYYVDGASIAGYVRYWAHDPAAPAWTGDRCGCPDDRCAGFHHDPDRECGCLETTLGEYAAAASGCMVCRRPVESANVARHVFDRARMALMPVHPDCRPAALAMLGLDEDGRPIP